MVFRRCLMRSQCWVLLKSEIQKPTQILVILVQAECGQQITGTPLPCLFVKLLSATTLLAVLIKPMSFNFGFLYWTGFQLVAPFAKPVLGSWVGDPETNPDSGHLPSGSMWPTNNQNTASMFVCAAEVSNTASSDFDQTYAFQLLCKCFEMVFHWWCLM